MLILLYHRIAVAPRDRWGMCVSPATFASHMRALIAGFRVHRLRDIESVVEGGSLGPRSVAVTFDDGYEDNLTTALPVLVQYGVPVTVFVSGARASFAGTFWWEWLDSALEKLGLGPAAAASMHARLATADPVARDDLLRSLPGQRDGLPRRLSADQLVGLASEPLVQIGAHGWSHRLLALLPATVLRAEIRQNLDELEGLTGARCRTLAYPFGYPVPEQTKAALLEEGITSAYAVEAAAATHASDPLALPRLEVGDWPVERFVQVVEETLARVPVGREATATYVAPGISTST